MAILLLEDKLGITEGYAGIWEEMLLGAGILPSRVRRLSIWKDSMAHRLQFLIKKGNRKSPGFNPDIQHILRKWMQKVIQVHQPELILCMDVALLGLFEPAWDIATIDNLRGGVYDFEGTPVLVMSPISAVHSQKKPKDIRAMNMGAETKDEFNKRFVRESEGEDDETPEDEDEPELLFIEPYTIPFGARIIAADLRKAYRIVSGTQGAIRPKMDIRIVGTRYDAREAERFLLSCVLIVSDIETLPDVGLMNVVGFTGLTNDGTIRTYVFPLYVSKNYTLGTPIDLGIYLQVIQKINDSGIPFAYHNGPYDLFWLMRYGLPVRNWAYDTMAMFWALFPEYPKSLAFVSSILLDDYVYWKGDRKSDDWETHLLYNGKDCHRTMQCLLRLIQFLSRDERSRTNWAHAHLRAQSCLGMSLRGMSADESKMAEYHVDLKEDAAGKLARIRYLIADPEFNPNSPQQKSVLLYKKLGIRFRNAKARFVNKLEDASTGALALRAMRQDHPVFRTIVNGIMEAIEPAKQISNVIGIKRTYWGRFYTSYNPVGTLTTRLGSSTAPINVGGNAQNIRKKYRGFIRADEGCFLLDIDFSAADDIFVSFESGDPKKIELFRSGKDTHSENATLFFPNWTYQMVVDGKRAGDDRVVHPITGIRQITKKLSHGCNYLMAALTLLATAGRDAVVAAAKESGYEDAGLWTQDRLASFCEYMESLYRQHYTRFARDGQGSWYSDLWDEFQHTSGFLTPFGYYELFLGDKHDRNILRGLAATAGQAGTAGRINMAMEELDLGIIPPRFRDADNPDRDDEPGRVGYESHGISLRLQTHDSLTFNIDPRHPGWRAGVERIYRVLGRPVVIRNKLTGGLETFKIGLESEVGTHWGKDLMEVKGNGLEPVIKTLESKFPSLTLQ